MHSRRRQPLSSAPAASAPTSIPPPPPPHPPSHHLQPVQDDDLRRLNLPPSIPVTRDGEEGAAAYNLRLQQSNAEAKSDCYQAPPNRTVVPEEPPVSSSAAASAPAVLSQHSTSTPSLKLIGGTTFSTQLHEASKYRSTKQQQQQQIRLLQQPTRFAEPHGHPSGTGDYVSGGLLASWRTTSPDRWELSAKKNIIPLGVIGGGLPSPPHLGFPGGSTPPGEEVLGGKRPATKQRSSSADSVRRLVAKCSLLRFTRKQTTKAPKPSTSGTPLAVDPARKQFDEPLEEGQTPGGAKDQEAPPWELPPNYVDMIFTKDPPATTTDSKKKDNVIKQQQHQEQQQRQQQHCCFNS